MNEQFTLQLERWTGREYVPHGQPQYITLAKAYAGQLGETARKLRLPAWRVVRCDKDRPRGKPRTWRPTPSHALSRSIEKVQRQYLEWAAAAGLECVTVYEGSYARDARPGAGQERIPLDQLAQSYVAGVRLVDPADFLGPAPDPEIIEEC